MIALLLMSLNALGTDLEAYPLAAEVTLPPTGTVRVELPPDLRTPEDPADASDLLLVDAEGRAVPVARIDSAPLWDADPFETASESPTADPNIWEIDVGDRPADGLEISVVPMGLGMTATVRDGRGDVVGGPTLVWRVAYRSQKLVPIEPTEGVLSVTLEPHGPSPRHPANIRPVLLKEAGVEAQTVRVAVSDVVVQENGWARYDIQLPQPLPVTGVRVFAAEPIFHRKAGIVPIAWETTPTDIHTYPIQPAQTFPLERVHFGETAVDPIDLPVHGTSDHLALLVDSRQQSPLDIQEVDLILKGAQLIVTNAGPGPHTLYAGARPGTSPPWDLAVATPEMTRLEVDVITPMAVQANPAWVPPEVRASLVDPSTEITLDGFAWRRTVTGVGLARISLDDDVLAHARRDLADLRLVTSDGRQIPYLLRRRGMEHAWTNLPTTRTEQGNTSVIAIQLPHADSLVSSVQIGTSAPMFSRPVTLSRPRGAQMSPIRSIRWMATDRPNRLGIEVGGRVGDTLVISIDNGDDPPLPIQDIEVRWPAWELIAVLPEGDVDLYSGDPRRTAPDYDLVLLSQEVRIRAVNVATVGERMAVAPPPISGMDKGLLAGGVALLILGLAGLLLTLLGSTPKDPRPVETVPPDAEVPSP